MNMNFRENAPRDRVEITLTTDANLSAPERARCETEIRAILRIDAIEVCDLSFQEGSTIITVCLLVGSGLGFCFAQFFCGAFKKLGEKSAELLLAKHEKKDANEAPMSLSTAIESITSAEFKIADNSGSDWPMEVLAFMKSAETASRELMAIAHNLPGGERSVTVIATGFDIETQERIEEIYQRKVSKR